MKWLPTLRLDSDRLREVIRTVSETLEANLPRGLPTRTPFAATPSAARGGVTEVASFGANPGALDMAVYLPSPPPRPGAPLVVVLHGCQQDAAIFAADTQWIATADRLGLPLLLPMQRAQNNPGRCFNWFRDEDTTAGHGEAASVLSMIDDAIRRFGSDPARVFVVGLSAGGALAASLLAAYPHRFAGGAVVAGLPVGAASGVGQALARMANAGAALPGAILADRARAHATAGEAGPWPRLSVWHGTADQTVDPANGLAVARQFAALHGLDTDAPTTDQPMPGVSRERWGDAVELWRIEGMAHGYPVTEPRPSEPHAARFVLQAACSATDRLAQFWGL